MYESLMAQTGCDNNAALRVYQTHCGMWKEELASHMVPRQKKRCTMRDESVSRMEQSDTETDANTRDALMELQKGGVCITHGAMEMQP